MIRGEVWLGLAVGGLLLATMSGCVGSGGPSSATQASRRVEAQLRAMDASGHRALFRDAHGGVEGKWRVRRGAVKVYDERLRAVGLVRHVRDASDIRVQGRRFDGARVTLREAEPGVFALGDVLTLEQQGAQGWLIYDPARRLLGRLVSHAGGERLTLVESAQSDAEPSYIITRDEARRPTLSRPDGEVLMRAPSNLMLEALVPFALAREHAELDAVSGGVLALFLERVAADEARSTAQ